MRALRGAAILSAALLVSTGAGPGSAATPAEVWDPDTGEFSPAGVPAGKRFSHVATRLADDRVLVIGGGDPETTDSLATAEIWDPATDAFTPAASLGTARVLPALTVLADERVLVSGGAYRRGEEGSELGSLEIWDPATDTFDPAGELVAGRSGHSATLLDDSRVLIAGGWGRFADSSARTTWAEIWDPDTRTSELVAPMRIPRAEHVAIPLSPERIAVIGGNVEAPPEIWSPSTERFERTETLGYERRYGFTASALPDGRVLIAGGLGQDESPYLAETWRPDPPTFGSATLLKEPRFKHTATVLPDGRVLIIGGRGVGGKLASAEIWDPATEAMEPTGSMAHPRSHHTATLLGDGRVLVVGGADERPD